MFENVEEIKTLFVKLGAEYVVLYGISQSLMEIAIEYLGKDEAKERLRRALQKRGIKTD